MTLVEMEKLLLSLSCSAGELKHAGGDMVEVVGLMIGDHPIRVKVPCHWIWTSFWQYEDPLAPYFDVHGKIAEATGINFKAPIVKMLFGWLDVRPGKNENDPEIWEITLTTPMTATEIFVFTEYDTTDKYLKEYQGIKRLELMDGASIAEMERVNAQFQNDTEAQKQLVEYLVKIPASESAERRSGQDCWVLNIHNGFLEEFREALEQQTQKQMQASAKWMDVFLKDAKQYHLKLEQMYQIMMERGTSSVRCKAYWEDHYLRLSVGANNTKRVYFIFYYDEAHLRALSAFMGKVRRDQAVPGESDFQTKPKGIVDLGDGLVPIHWYDEFTLKNRVVLF